MKKSIDPTDIIVESGVGFMSTAPERGGTAVVVVTIEHDAGPAVTFWVSPVVARRVGMDLISAAVAGTNEAAIRAYARRKGVDADEIIAEMKAAIRLLLDLEEHP